MYKTQVDKLDGKLKPMPLDLDPSLSHHASSPPSNRRPVPHNKCCIVM